MASVKRWRSLCITLPLVLFLLLGSCSRNLLHTTYLRDSIVDHDLLSLLSRIHDERKTEIVACLDGRIRNDTLYIDRLGAARIVFASADSVRFYGCGYPKFYGTYHNHPNDACSFSPTDLNNAYRSGSMFNIVSCGRGRFVWWRQAQQGEFRVNQ